MRPPDPALKLLRPGQAKRPGATTMTGDTQPEALDPDSLPKHVGIIMDGNGRWAKREGVTRAAGHEAGAKSVRAVVETCRELGLDSLSLYAFSTENWRRTKTEVNALFRLLTKYIRIELDNIDKEDIRVFFSGRRDGLAPKTIREIDQAEAQTVDNKSMILNVCVNYGGRAEIVDAARDMAKLYYIGTLGEEDFTEEQFEGHLYRPEIPNLDLLIRTSGEQRISNFMLWQVSYAEIIITETLWPDFRKDNLREAFLEYQRRSRRFGGR